MNCGKGVGLPRRLCSGNRIPRIHRKLHLANGETFIWMEMRQHVTTTEVKVWLSEEKGKEREGEKTKTTKSGSD